MEREFHPTSYGEWLAEFRNQKWPTELPQGEEIKAFSASKINMDIALSMASGEDYYQQVRAAIILGTMIEVETDWVTKGMLAHATHMLKRDELPPTHLMGAELCSGALRLKEQLEIPDETVVYVRNLLREKGEHERVSSSARIVEEWIITDMEKPFAVFLRERNQALVDTEALLG